MSDKMPDFRIRQPADADSISPPLSRIRIVLVAPSHPGNIGAAARAMRTMGLSRLYLVQPEHFPDPDATARAAGADTLLDAAVVCSTLDEALQGCVLALGCTARQRGVPITELEPREAARQALATTADGEVALVFGRERSGLENAELARCQAAVHIPTSADFSSLNLGAAVQVLSYELRLAALAASASGSDRTSTPPMRQRDPPATQDELEGFFGHLEQALEVIQFHKGRNTDTVLTRLRRLYLRAGLDEREVRILRGVLAETIRCAGRNAASEQ